MKHRRAFTLVELPAVSEAKRKAFTLVELLVVIGIIAVLVAILLPALNKARQAAKATVLASNLHQCGLGLQMYANSFAQMVPVFRVKGGADHAWPFFLAYGQDIWDDPGQPIYIPPQATLCPSNQFYPTDYNTLTNTSVAYAMFLVSSSSAGTQAIYFNSTFQRTIVNPTDPTWTVKVQKLTGLPTPAANSVWLADSLSNHPSSYGGGGHMYGLFCDQTLAPFNGAVQILHNNRANALFYDGHVEAMTDTQLRNNTATRVRYFYASTNVTYTLP